MNTKHLVVSSVFGLGLLLALLWALNDSPLPTTYAAAPRPHSVQANHVITVCLPSAVTCDFADVQAAVDAAAGGDVIKLDFSTAGDVSRNCRCNRVFKPCRSSSSSLLRWLSMRAASCAL